MKDSPATYRVIAVNATVRDKPMGTQLRRLARGETFRGRPAAPGWIARLDDDGETVTGYVRAVNVAVERVTGGGDAA